MPKDKKKNNRVIPSEPSPWPTEDKNEDEPIPVPPGEPPPTPIQDPPLPGQQTPIEEVPEEPKIYVQQITELLLSVLFVRAAVYLLSQSTFSL